MGAWLFDFLTLLATVDLTLFLREGADFFGV
jgi:hypothetical protein